VELTAADQSRVAWNGLRGARKVACAAGSQLRTGESLRPRVCGHGRLTSGGARRWAETPPRLGESSRGRHRRNLLGISLDWLCPRPPLSCPTAPIVVWRTRREGGESPMPIGDHGPARNVGQVELAQMRNWAASPGRSCSRDPRCTPPTARHDATTEVDDRARRAKPWETCLHRPAVGNSPVLRKCQLRPGRRNTSGIITRSLQRRWNAGGCLCAGDRTPSTCVTEHWNQRGCRAQSRKDGRHGLAWWWSYKVGTPSEGKDSHTNCRPDGEGEAGAQDRSSYFLDGPADAVHNPPPQRPAWLESIFCLAPAGVWSSHGVGFTPSVVNEVLQEALSWRLRRPPTTVGPREAARDRSLYYGQQPRWPPRPPQLHACS